MGKITVESNIELLKAMDVVVRCHCFLLSWAHPFAVRS